MVQELRAMCQQLLDSRLRGDDEYRKYVNALARVSGEGEHRGFNNMVLWRG
jgi:hypothetical protein